MKDNSPHPQSPCFTPGKNSYDSFWCILAFYSKCVHCCCLVTQSCPTLCDPMDCSTPGSPSFTISRILLKLMSIESMMPSNYLILCHRLLLLPSIFPIISVFSNGSALSIRWLSIGVSASISVLPLNTQDLSPLGWTGWISLQSKGLSRVLSNTTV